MNEFVNLYILSLVCAEAHKCYDMMNNSVYKNTTANTNVDLNRDLRNTGMVTVTDRLDAT